MRDGPDDEHGYRLHQVGAHEAARQHGREQDHEARSDQRP